MCVSFGEHPSCRHAVARAWSSVSCRLAAHGPPCVHGAGDVHDSHHVPCLASRVGERNCAYVRNSTSETDMPVWSTEAANELISLAKDRPLTHMHIQKLVYISHGWTLAICDRTLTIDDPEAWRFGPVYRLIWDNLRYAGSYPVTRKIPDGAVEPYPDSAGREWRQKEREIVKQVHHIYGDLAAFQLSALTHRQGTPWRKVYGDGTGQDQHIPSSMIRDHFLGLAAQRS